MLTAGARQDPAVLRRILSVVLWLAASTGLIVAVFSVIQEMCLASACRDTVGFTLFGVDMGWFGIAYFSAILILLWLQRKFVLLEQILAASIFAGIGAEFRLLWIQKNVIGSWCPLCVTICCALFIAAAALLIGKVLGTGADQGQGGNLAGWMVFIVSMIAAGLAVAFVGVRA